jgi:RHS repeat-associated protein
MSRLCAFALLGLALIAATPAQAQIAFRSASSATATGLTPAFRSAASATTTGATLTITKPSGVAVNDVLIASIALTPSTVAITPPSGWVLIRRSDNAGPTSNSLAVYYKVVVGTEPSSYPWGVSGASFTVGGIQAFTGVDTTTPIDVENGQTTPSATTHAAPSVTTTTANTMVVTSHAFASSRQWTPPTGMTESFDKPSGSNNATGMGIEGTRVLLAVAGATGVKTATASGDADAGNTHILALKPRGVSLAIATPAGVQANDVLIAAVGFNNASAAVTPPSGWTLVRRVSNSSTTSNALAVYRRVAQAGEPSSHAFAIAGGAFLVGGIQAFSGVDTANPIDVENGQSATAHDTPSVTTTTANAMLVTSHTFASAATWTPQSGQTEGFDRMSGTKAATAGQAITGGYQLQAVAGASGTKRATASANADVGNTHILALRRFVPNNLPTVSLTSPGGGATFTAPATITLTATASDTDGTITKVEFFHGGTSLIATVTTAPYTYQWTNVAAAGYTLTAKATDNLQGITTSNPVTITVNAQATLYYIHPDHLNSPRTITNQAQQVVWKWDQEDPFGANMATENPGGLGTFTFNLRFPGQYFDKETNQHYNYFRDYSPEIGRYIESDPLGLFTTYPPMPVTRLNHLYTYVGSDPLLLVDFFGLAGASGTWSGGVTSSWDVPFPIKWPPPENCAGCGTGWSEIVPDVYPNACDRHDKCYSTPGRSKASCDWDFFKDAFAESGPNPNVVVPFIYFLGPVLGGRDPYNKAQSKARGE